MDTVTLTSYLLEVGLEQWAAADDTVTVNGILNGAAARLYMNPASPTPAVVYDDLDLVEVGGLEDESLDWNSGVAVNGPANSKLLANAGILKAAESDPSEPITITGFAVTKLHASSQRVLGYHQFATPVVITYAGDYVTFQPCVKLKPNQS